MNFSHWFRKREWRDASLDDEIRAHLDMAVRDRIARGESPDAALAAARREFGNVAHVKEVTREMWGGIWRERLLQDLHYAFRSLRRAPSFTLVAVLTLALGIGANTAMFTVMNAVLLRPLPFSDPGRLFTPSYTQPPSIFAPIPGLYDRHYLAFERDTTIFERIGTYYGLALTLSGSGDPVKVATTAATPSLFDALRMRPIIGRGFASNEAEPGQDGVVIIGQGLGSVITLEGRRRTVIGIMPSDRAFPAMSDLWTPLKVLPQEGNFRLGNVVGRLKDGMTLDQAKRAFAIRAAQFELPPGFNRDEFVPNVVPLKQVLIGDAQRPLLVFAGAVLFVLLIACANVANLLLMRMTSRDREMAVRGALGAGRARLIRQLLTETLVLAMMGAALGVLVALAGLQMLMALAPFGTIPRAESVHLDLTALAFTAGLSIVTAIVCGLVPALHATEHRLIVSLTSAARTIAGTHARLRSALVVGEIAAALVLLVGAGLLLRSFNHMRSVELGFDPSNVIAATIDLPDNVYRTDEASKEFGRRVLERLRAVPGVEAVGTVNWAPLGGNLIRGDFTLEDGRKLPEGVAWADKPSTSPGYFRAMGQRIRAGRDFNELDRAGSPRVVIISQSLAEKLWPKGDAIGKRVSMNDKPKPEDWLSIVGVVNDVVQTDVKVPRGPAMYVPMEQTTGMTFLSHVNFVVRHSGSASTTIAAMRQVVRDIDPNLAIGVLSSMDERISSTTLQPRFQSRVLLTFSIVALVLAVIGIYGILAYGVGQRIHELGVRIALGAAPADVMSLVLRRTLLLTVPGVLIGLGAAFALTRVLGKFLFKVRPTDPATFAATSVLLAIVALAAAYGPARRASRVDPMMALRPE
jgi:putative ABC transport system permease protein